MAIVLGGSCPDPDTGTKTDLKPTVWCGLKAPVLSPQSDKAHCGGLKIAPHVNKWSPADGDHK